MLKSAVVDAATGVAARVDPEGHLGVRSAGFPLPGEGLKAIPYAAYMTDANGSSDMLVDGSVTPVEFAIRADPENEVYVKRLSLLISDATASLNQFGAIAALTNGLLFQWTATGRQIDIATIHSNFDAVRFSGGVPAFGDGNNSFRANNVVSTSEAFLPVLDMQASFGFPWGLPLAAGSVEKLSLIVRDNVSTIDALNVIATGFQLLPVGI